MTPPRTSDEVREAFLSFFRERGHPELPAWPLVPIGDPTSMFTSAGMQQFKPVFTGEQERPAARAATVQPCFRTTDIEEVGDHSHLTAFEMLGNFSFGDYFKRDAIRWAWELLTEVYQIPADRLHITIFKDDEEAYNVWRHEVELPDSHIHRCDEDKNYWFSFPNGTPGASGPLGPCSEIFYDFTPGESMAGINPAYEDERFLEIWNLVFMELFQHPDGSREPLPTKNIDTGSGLERVAAVLQDVKSVFETDIFLPIIETAAQVAGVDYFGGAATSEQEHAIRAMAEHCRAATMLVGDGVVPSNEGRGYVLRRVIRRGVYFGRQIGVTEPFTGRLVEAAIEKLKVGYPHLDESREFILKAITTEEERFVRTLAAGSARLDIMLDRSTLAGRTVLDGAEAFLLYDTFGLPLELTREIAGRNGFDVDVEGFEVALEEQRHRARRQGGFLKGEVSPALRSLGDDHSAFVGYSRAEAEGRVVAILAGGSLVDSIEPGAEAEVVLETTPFYPEGGGQMGDRGTLSNPNACFEVADTQAAGGAIVHRGKLADGKLAVGDLVEAEVDHAWRRGATGNHTSTHLLHAALREILGEHVRQQGSLVSSERLRFDFTHLEQVPREALREVEVLANARVRDNLAVSARTTDYRSAVAGGALAFFGDKYGAEVRVVEIGGDGDRFSAELCGGTHVHATGELGFVHILRESAVAAGTRRIEAISSAQAEQYLLEQDDRIGRLASRLNVPATGLEERVEQLRGELDDLRQQAARFQREQGASIAGDLAASAADVGGHRLVVARVDLDSADALTDMADALRNDLKSALVILGAAPEGKAVFLVAATPDLVSAGVHAGNLIREIAAQAGGGGGGRPDMARAGANDASRLDDALTFADSAARKALAAV
jgi:alanyl-tRNA synthetase